MNTHQTLLLCSDAVSHGPVTYGAGECGLGRLLVARNPRGVCAIFLGEDDAKLVQDLSATFPGIELIEDGVGLQAALAEVARFVTTPAGGLSMPLAAHGTEFQQAVWSALMKVPAGETLSYTELARRVGKPRAVRAVASACAANRLAVAVPCHRVVRNDGSVSGYRWGAARKRELLSLERLA